ncbi:MAG: Gfo/Idh/MocA family oxidoreductase [Verrucomicrobiae bacterium]|nr:Gfo/Idh/MocA family oxidoreductase [Verrucomicrobiae bacterium]
MPSRRHVLSALGSIPAVSVLSPAVARGKAEPLKYLQIGTGHAHANKLSTYHESPDWEVVGIVEPDPERLASARKSDLYGQFPFYSLDDGLNLPGLKAVGIETEVRNLLHFAELAVDAGYHIHLDKPAGESLAHFRRIYEKAERANLTIQMGYMYRYNPAVTLMMDCLEKGWLGEPFEVHTVMSKVIDADGRKGLDDYAGGIMFELGCHIVDLTLNVLGAPDRVTAYPRRVLNEADDSLVDNMLAVLEYPKATATIRSAAVEVEGFARRHFVVCGTEGTCHIQPLDRPSVKLALSKDRGDFHKGYQEITFDPPYRRYVGDAADFAAIIRGEKAPRWGRPHDLAVQETVLRAAGVNPDDFPAPQPPTLSR